MWSSTVVFETAKDRFVADTTDPAASQGEALANRQLFLARQGGRLICASDLRRDPDPATNLALKPMTRARDIQPWRPDLRADTRPVHFETRPLPDGPGALLPLAFDDRPDWLPAFPAPSETHSMPLETFALVDAALNMAFPDVLFGSGLDHRCLFSGPTAEKLAEVVPYLVRLTSQSPITRALFDPSSPPVGQWGLQSALILRSRLGLHGLRRSLRAFLRLEQEAGKRPLFFRFYAPAVFRSVVPALELQVHRQMLAGIDLVLCPGARTPDCALIVHRGQGV